MTHSRLRLQMPCYQLLSLYSETYLDFYFMRGKYNVNHQILAVLDLGGQVFLLNKDRLSTLFKAFSFDWK